MGVAAPSTGALMRVARLSRVRLAFVLVLAVALGALVGAPGGASARGKKHRGSHAREIHRDARGSVRVHRHFRGRAGGGVRHATLDRSPAVSWTTPKAGTTVSGLLHERARNCIVSASSSKGIDHVAFYLDGTRLNTQWFVPYSCIWDTTKAADGSSHTLKAVAYDTVGRSASVSLRVIVHNAGDTPPETTITGGPSETTGSAEASFTFSSSEAGSSFECRFDAESWGSCSSPKSYSQLAEGAHGFEVRATDAAGNTDPTPATRSFMVDNGGGNGDARYPALAKVDWDGDFDSGCDLVGRTSGAWDVDATNADYSGSSTTIERTVVGEGQCAAKFTNRAASHGTRAELARSATGADPEFVYEVLVRVPSGQTFPKGSDITQTKMEKVGGDGCYGGGWDISDGTGTSDGRLELRTVPRCTRRPQVVRIFPAGPLPRDRWFALKLHEKFSNDPRVGFVHAWMDADGLGPGGYTEVVPKTHIDNETAPHVRLRIGSYRQATNHKTVVYMDGFHLDCIFHC
jgi:hypothetical protein